jgi:hypothetical protein
VAAVPIASQSKIFLHIEFYDVTPFRLYNMSSATNKIIRCLFLAVI